MSLMRWKAKTAGDNDDPKARFMKKTGWMFKNKAFMIAATAGVLLFLSAFSVFAAGAESNKNPGDVPLRENGIPVVTLTVDPEELKAIIDTTRHEYRSRGGSVRIDVADGYTCEYGEIDAEVLGTELTLEFIRGRGNSTWVLSEKKPFKFKLEKGADIFSMGKNKHWVLLANALDETLLKNRLAAYMGRQLGLDYTPMFVPVDLVINGEYWGSYLLGHEIRIGSNRIDIEELKEDDTDPDMITGGYLLALEPDLGEEEINLISTKRGVNFLVDDPDFSEYDENKEKARDVQRDYIESYLQRVEDAVFGEGFKNASGESARDLLDYESAAKFWWVQEFTVNADGMVTPSSYLYKVRSGKLYFGPLWDFDRAFYPSYNDLSLCRMLWLDHLRAYDADYQSVLLKTWEELKEILREITLEGGILDRYAEEIRASRENDRELWGENYPSRAGAEKLIEDLRAVIDERRLEIEENISRTMTKVYVTVTFTADGDLLKTEMLKVRDCLPDEKFPSAPEKKGFSFTGWVDEFGMNFTAKTKIRDDMKVHAAYAAAETSAVKTAEDSNQEEASPSSEETHPEEIPLENMVIGAAFAASVGLFVWVWIKTAAQEKKNRKK